MEMDQGMKKSFEEEEGKKNVPGSSLSQSLHFSVLKSVEDFANGAVLVDVVTPEVHLRNHHCSRLPNAAVAAAEESSRVLHRPTATVDVEIADCFQFVSASSSSCVVDREAAGPHGESCEEEDHDVDVVSECLDFVQADQSECFQDSLKEEEDRVLPGGRGGAVVDGEVFSHCMEICKSESLQDSFDGHEGCVEVASGSLDFGGGVVVVVHGSVVGEEEELEVQLLVAQVAKSCATTTGAGESAASGSDSGECSSGENNKEERTSSRKLGGSKNANIVAAGKKKAKVDWTPELHRRFVHAVEQLGVEKAFPSRILELMGVQCLTRHNIASHLQKYRSHRRHLAAREAEAASWSHNRRPYSSHSSRNRTSRRTSTDKLPYLVPVHSNSPPIQPRPSPVQPHTVSHAHHQMQQPLMTTPLKVWGYPTMDHSSLHMWQPPPVSPPSFWQAPDGSYWQHPAASGYDIASQPAVQAPTRYPHPMRVPLATMPSSTAALAVQGSFSELDSFFAAEALPVSMYLCNSYESDFGTAGGGSAGASSTQSCESHLSKEILYAAISEALANPWTPPPLGLKPPSMEGVIAELQRQGINTVPPSTC